MNTKKKIYVKNNGVKSLKYLKERNRKAARACRKRKRNQEQELEDGLLKKKAVPEEELTSLKELYSKKKSFQLAYEETYEVRDISCSSTYFASRRT